MVDAMTETFIILTSVLGTAVIIIICSALMIWLARVLGTLRERQPRTYEEKQARVYDKRARKLDDKADRLAANGHLQREEALRAASADYRKQAAEWHERVKSRRW